MEILTLVWPVALGLLLLIAANIALGSCDAWIAGKFDVAVLIKGLIKGLIIALCALGAYIAGWLNGDIAFNFNGENVTLAAAMTVLMIAAYSLYAVAVLKKLYSLFKLDTSGDTQGQMRR